jgi:hypothetical protein
MVSGRTRIQCRDRWHNFLDPNIALTTGSKGTWTEDEDLKLKGARQMHGGKNWNKIAAMVPGRTQKQCSNRWYNVMDRSIALTAGSMGTWTEDEDLELKVAVQKHGGMNLNKIAAIVPGRTKSQCKDRWHNALDPKIALTAESTGKWTEDDDEDNKVENSVQMHGPQLPRWSHIERKSSGGIDGSITGTLIVGQSGGKNTVVSIRRLLCGGILTPLDTRRIHGLRYLYQVLYHRWHLWTKLMAQL